MRFLPVCAVFLTLGAVQAFGAAADGKAVYDAKCKGCHKADGSGMAAMKMKRAGLRRSAGQVRCRFEERHHRRRRQDETANSYRCSSGGSGSLHSHAETISSVRQQRARPGATRFRSRAPYESSARRRSAPRGAPVLPPRIRSTAVLATRLVVDEIDHLVLNDRQRAHRFMSTARTLEIQRFPASRSFDRFPLSWPPGSQ